MIYIIHALATRCKQNQKLVLSSCGYNQGVESSVLGVYTDKNKALGQIKKIATHFEDVWKESVFQTYHDRGKIADATVISEAVDEQGEKWVTQIYLETISETDNEIDTNDLYFQI